MRELYRRTGLPQFAIQALEQTGVFTDAAPEESEPEPEFRDFEAARELDRVDKERARPLEAFVLETLTPRFSMRVLR